jgi:hypothetical protein
MMPYQSADCCLTHFPVDLMINGFDLSNWNNNNKSDGYTFEGLTSDYIPTTGEEYEINIFSLRCFPSLLFLPNDFIPMIEDKYNLMTERLRHQILTASPHAEI